MEDWEERAARACERFENGAARLPDDPDQRQRQLTRMGNAAWAAGVSFLMLGRDEAATQWLLRAAATYRESWLDAPPESWGRPLGAMKARLVAGDLAGARDDARWTLDAGAKESASPIGRYAAALALLVLGEDAPARPLVSALPPESIPPAVVDALAALASADADGYRRAAESLVAEFESREAFLEDVPVADTVLAFQALAATRGLAVPLRSALLPAETGCR